MITPFFLIALTTFSFASCASANVLSPSKEVMVPSAALPLNTSPAINSPKLTGNIQLRNRELLVDGKPFVIKAVCYNPVTKGKNVHNGLILAAPTAADLALIEKDFQMMQAAGVNTIRTYVPITNERILNLLVKYHLKTIVPIFNSLVSIPFSSITKKVAELTSTLKNHPSTLIWEIGNEWNYNNFYSNETSSPNAHDSIDLLKKAIAAVRSQDTTHPISTVIGDLPKDEHFWSTLPDSQIDLYGSNIYDGLTFGDRLIRWKKISNKPLYIGEFGASAFNSLTNSEDGHAQAVAVKSLLTEVQNNLSLKHPDNVLVGGAIFEWNDEWWKGGGSPEVHGNDGFYLIPDKTITYKVRIYPQDLASDTNIPKVSGPYPDHIFHEKWWGIVDINRRKRPAYQALKEVYVQ